MIEHLLQHGADVTRTCKFGHSCLTPLELARTKNKENALRILENSSLAPISQAAKNGHVADLHRIFGELGGKEEWRDILDRTDTAGCTALHLAAQNGHVDCVDALLKMGASSCIKDKRGRSALQVAAQQGHVDCVQLLVDREDANTESFLTGPGLVIAKAYEKLLKELRG